MARPKTKLRWEAYMRVNGNTWEDIYGSAEEAMSLRKKGEDLYLVEIKPVAKLEDARWKTLHDK